MEQVQIMASPRAVIGKKVKRLREQGVIPLVVYGRKTDSLNLKAIEFDVRRAVARASGQLIELHVDQEDNPRMVLAREVQRDVITGNLLHVDFYEVDMTEKVRVEVQLALVGEPKLVRSGEATLLQTLTTVEIECLPADIMQSIEVDTSSLESFDDSLFVRDLVLPETSEILTSPGEMIVKVEPIEEEEVEEVEEFEMFDVGDVEVIQRGKEEDEEEAEPAQE